MRNPNKYYRNKHAKQNARRRAFAINGGEFAYRSYMPFMWSWSESNYNHDEQLANHIEYVENHWVRTFLNGNQRGTFHAPKWLKKNIERSERHIVNQMVNQYKIMNVDDIDDYDLPTFKHHADWDWF